MFLKCYIAGALLIIFYCTSVIADSITLNAQNVNQPLVIKREEMKRKYYLTASPPNLRQDGMMILFSSISATLILACPGAESSNSDYPEALSENSNNDIDCEKDFRPSLKKKNHVLSNTSMYAIGYWLYWNVPKDGKICSTPTFVKIYDMHYSATNGVLYTIHKVYPGLRLLYEDIQSVETELIKDERYENDLKFQLVPFHDFIPYPWKYTTRLDFNFIYVNYRIVNYINILVNFIRNHSNTIENPLTVYSGKKDRMWYWKVIEYDKSGIFFAVVDPNAENFENPCANQCVNYSLGFLLIQIPNLYCCPLTENLARELKLVVLDKESNVRYLQFSDELLEFLNKYFAERTKTRQRTYSSMGMYFLTIFKN